MTPPVVLLLAASALAAQTYSVTGVVLSVDAQHRTFTASCAEIPGYMAAMTMPFAVRDPKQLNGISPGANIGFTLSVEGKSSWAHDIHIVRYESLEQEPMRARRLELLAGAPQTLLKRGDSVPDFTLTDQTGRPVTLSNLRGRVVALDFIYTTCPLPDYCFRLSNNFARMAKRFVNKEVVFLSITFDPVRDTPAVLASYAQTFRASAAQWHFLTGELSAVKAVCRSFGLNFWQDEGSLTHQLRTLVIDKTGRLAATFEGNRITPAQMGDFIDTQLNRAP